MFKHSPLEMHDATGRSFTMAVSGVYSWNVDIDGMAHDVRTNNSSGDPNVDRCMVGTLGSHVFNKPKSACSALWRLSN